MFKKKILGSLKLNVSALFIFSIAHPGHEISKCSTAWGRTEEVVVQADKSL